MDKLLSPEGYEVESFSRGKDFLERMARKPFQIAFIDLKLPDMKGMEILRILNRDYENVQSVIMTGYGSIDSAVYAIKHGAYHYLQKPFKRDEVIFLASGAREKIDLKEENLRLKKELGDNIFPQEFLGSTPVMQEIFLMIKKVAGVNCNVLIQGETGTGKELAARSIHRLSPRRERAFVSFNCGGFTEELICAELFGHEKGAFTGATARKIGLLESADGGTVFLDEIGEMSLPMQVRLLHVLQEKRILRVGGTKPIDLDIRIIAATNRDLKLEVESGIFRKDLYYRLNVVALALPRLVDRTEDIPLLIANFIKKYRGRFAKKARNITEEALDVLMNYDFPGNVRELENIIQRAMALSDGEVISLVDLPGDLRELEFDTLDGEGLISMEEMEKKHITRVLEKTGYNKAQASKILNLPRTTLWRKMKKYKLTDAED